jgi:predicted protein tyrosine phosphatase
MSPNYDAPGRPKLKYILTIIDSADKQPRIPAGREGDFVLKLILLRDQVSANLVEVLKDAITFIKDSLAKKDGGVLVHCQQGKSRSASVVIAFAMEEMDLVYDAAFRYVREKRRKVSPNPSFIQQLILWRQLKYSVMDADGKEKEEYISWRKLLPASAPDPKNSTTTSTSISASANDSSAW